jgi:hypothetical protein
MKSKQGKLKILIFFLIGAIAFTTNAKLDINPYFQYYLSLLEAQGGIFLVVYCIGISKGLKINNKD